MKTTRTRRRRAPSLRGLVARGTLFLALAGLASGCAPQVFHTPAAISTHVSAAADAERIQRVTREKCSLTVIIFPFATVDLRDGYDELLAEATRVGGNAVVDLQVRAGKSVALIPLFQRQCLDYTGVAARL